MPKDTITDNSFVAPDANAQAKAALPKPQYMAPAEDLTQGTKLQNAYDAAKSWLGEHEKNLSDEYLKPFREGLDRMSQDLETAGETGKTKSGGQLNDATRALASGAGAALKMVPVGKNVSETVQANIVPPELEELGVQLHPEQIVKDAGLIYKGELTKGSGVHMFEHPEHPGMTASLHESEFTPEAVQKKIQSKMDDFGVTKRSVSGQAKSAESAPKKLPPVGDNYRTDLSKYTDTLHHETSVDRALALIPGGGVSSELGDLYFSNVPELATGQGKNKGVRLELDSKGISGQVNRSKPMADAAYDRGSAEFWAKHNDQKTIQKNVKAVTIDKNAEATKGEMMMLRQTQKRLEANGWTKTKTENGIRYERPNPETQNKWVTNNASGESAASQEALNRSASEKSQGKQRVRIDSRSLKETPLIGADAVDAKVGDYDHIAIRNSDGSYAILDSGAKARPLSGQPKPASVEPKISAKPAQKAGISKEDSKLAANYVAELLKKSKD